ncbi:MAG: M16 family metallopeptidase [Polyangiales bacterium]
MRTFVTTALCFGLALAVGTAASAPAPITKKSPVPKVAPIASIKPPAKDSSESLRPKLAIERFTLSNGLRVVLNPDPTSPTVSVVVWYDVGSRNERAGEGGFAHMFEHLMFEGTPKVPRGQYDTLITGRGGKLNAATSEDWTRYFEMLPSSELSLALFLESDRMQSLKVDQEAFENQRKVVQEEYRMRVANAPYVKGYFKLNELLYDGWLPYAHPAIGSMKELDEAKIEWVRAFHDAYYAPNNAVLVIAGDFPSDDAKALVHKYFDGLARHEIKAFDAPKFTPRETGVGPVTVDDALARTPMAYLGWVIPPDGEKDHYALEVAATILTGGESSRQHRRLVRDLAWAQDVDADTNDHRGPDLFEIDARLADCAGKPVVDPKTKESVCKTPVKIEDVERVAQEEIDDLAKRGPTAVELSTARAKIEHSFLFGLQSNLSRAMVLAKFEGQRGDASLLAGEVEKYLAVTADDVKAATAKWLKAKTAGKVRVVPATKSAQRMGEKPAEKAAAKKAVK